MLLRWLTWPEAAALALSAFLFNWQLLPRLGGRTLWREAEHGRGYPAGILLYPLSVLALVLTFRHQLWVAAAVWGVLAWGDGMASLAGQRYGVRRLPWNAQKTWAGFGAFVVFGAAAAAVLTVWTAHLPAGTVFAPWLAGVSLALALVCALVESLPLGLDDNVTVPLAGGLAMAALMHVKADGGGDAAARVGGLLALNAAIAAAAWRARALDAPGAASTFLIGSAITAGLGLPGLAVIATFFMVGTAATHLRFAQKARYGLAQERGGVRGWRNAWANGAVPAALALGALLIPETAGLWAVAYAGAVATACADTGSSEIGKASARRAFLVPTLREVPAGTTGAVSGAGTLGGLACAAIVAAVGCLCGLYPWPAAAIVTGAGVLGGLAESVLGATVGRRGWLSGHALNAANTAIGGALAVGMFLLLKG